MMIVEVALEGSHHGSQLVVVKPGRTVRAPLRDSSDNPQIVDLTATEIHAVPVGDWLTDGTVVAGIKLERESGSWFEYERMPGPLRLWELLTIAVNHDKAYPDHGVNCVCMDDLIREIRLNIHRAAPESPASAPDIDAKQNVWGGYWKARARISHILQTAIRNW